MSELASTQRTAVRPSAAANDPGGSLTAGTGSAADGAAEHSVDQLPHVQPFDELNRRLLHNVHPPDWHNPTPAGRYHLVVVGAGTAGLVSAAIAASLGARVALVERDLMGGDCLNVGCVPSKALLSAARVARTVRRAPQFGVHTATPQSRESVAPTAAAAVDFAAVMQRMRTLRADISPHDSAARFRDLGVDVFLGQGTFTGPDTLDVDGTTLRFKKAVIATGARAAAPPIPGLDSVSYLTNESLFSLTELPKRFGIIGAGPIGCEMAQAFANFGAEVLLVEAMHGVLPREDRAAADIIESALREDGVRLLCCGKNLKLAPDGDRVRMTVDSHGTHYDEAVDALLVSVGRRPNVDNLGLEAAGVKFDLQRGVEVDDRLRTANPRIFAAGDVCSAFKFTHAADFMARLVIRNALFLGRGKASRLTIPWCTYTSPELAHVGLSEADAESRGIAVDTYVQPFAELDRAILEGQTEGFVKAIVRRGSDEILGATIVAEHAGDMIGEITLAMQHNIGLKTIGNVIHPYPTFGEAIRKLGDRFNRTRLTPRTKRLLKWWLGK